MTVDYADENMTISNLNESKSVECNKTNEVLLVNDTEVGIAKIQNNGKEFIEKPKTPIVTITCKPSCGCGGSYTWRTRSYIDYCPHCHRYNVLYDAHKWQARYEKELTCRYCGADYCGNCGKEKYSWSRYYLRRA